MWPSNYFSIESLIQDSKPTAHPASLISSSDYDKRLLHQQWNLFNHFISKSNFHSNHVTTSMLPFIYLLPSYISNSNPVQTSWSLSPPRSPGCIDKGKLVLLISLLCGDLNKLTLAVLKWSVVVSSNYRLD